MTENAKYTIRLHPDPILQSPCPAIPQDEFGPEIEKLGQDMLQILAVSNGVGLAAPQIGLLKRILVMKVKPTDPGLVLCNPVFEPLKAIDYAEEGCLSLPGIFEQVFRPTQGTVHFLTPDGTKTSLQLEGTAARVVQHEIDHLDGVLFFERVPHNLKKKVLRSWEKKRLSLQRSRDKDKHQKRISQQGIRWH